MTKVKFRVQWTALLCLAALLVGVLSVFLFRNTVTAQDALFDASEDFSSLEGKTFKHTPGGSTATASTPYTTSMKWVTVLYNQDDDGHTNDTEKYVAFADVEGNDGGVAAKLLSAYADNDANCHYNYESVRFYHEVGLSLKDDCGFMIRLRFMIPDRHTNARFYMKANSKEWPGNMFSVLNGKLTVGTTVLTVDYGHWYDFTMIYSETAKKTTLVLDGVEYTPDSKYVSYDYDRIEYPIMQCYRSSTGGDSVIYMDDYRLCELSGDYSVLTDRMEVSPSTYTLRGDTAYLVGGMTLGDLRENTARSYDTEILLLDGETEITDDATLITEQHKLLFRTKNGVYKQTFSCSVPENRPADKEVTDTFDNSSFRIEAGTASENGYYKDSSTDLFKGVPSSVTFAAGDYIAVTKGPFLTGDNRALVLHSDAANRTANLKIVTDTLPYIADTGYGHIIELDVITAAAGGKLTLTRAGIADTVTVDGNGITFDGKTAKADGLYHHLTWEITAAGMQSLYVDGTLLSQKQMSGTLNGAGALTVSLTKSAAVEATYAIDNLSSYITVQSVTPTKNTVSPSSSSVSFNEEEGTYYIQVSLRDVAYLTGTFGGEGSVAFFNKAGKQIKLGNLVPEDCYLVYYPAGNGTPKFYTYGSPEFSLSSIYADGMVLQRGREITLSGFSNATGMTVKARLTDAKGDLVAEGTGITEASRFTLTLPALTAQKDLTLKITIANEEETFLSETFRNVAIGEVWLLGGQSNMWLPLHMLEDAEAYLANADNYGDNIRYYSQARKASFTPEKETVDGKWLVATEENLRTTEISGIGYVCASRLASELGDVTVAVIDVYYAGSSIVAWFDLDTIKSEYPDLYTTYEKNLGTTPSSWNTIPSVCYNRMVNPIKGYTAAGMLWYQGESDCGNAKYADYYKTLTSLWREWTKNDALPFVVMQLAPYAGSSYPSFRSLQYNMVAADPHSYLISTSEDGPVFSMADNVNGYGYAHVHPARKSGIGLRAADMILGEVYGVSFKSAYKAPELLSAVQSGSSVILTFDTELSLLHGTKVEGFTLNGVAAVGVINGKTLTLTADGVTEPTVVAYAQDTFTVVMKDGTVYRNITNVVVSDDRQTTTFKCDGKTVTVGAWSHDVLRSTYGGNLTNSSGYALPAFSLSVTAE